MAYQFGVGSKVVTSLSVTNTVRSYAFWFYQTGVGGSNQGRIFDKNGTGFSDRERFNVVDSGANLSFFRAWNTNNGNWKVPAPTQNEWHHCVITYDSSNAANTPIIYIDGVSATVTIASAPAGTLRADTGAKYVIGNNDTATDYFWSGNLAEWTVWDSILTADDVTLLFEGIYPTEIGAPASYVDMFNSDQDAIIADAVSTSVNVVEHPPVGGGVGLGGSSTAIVGNSELAILQSGHGTIQYGIRITGNANVLNLQTNTGNIQYGNRLFGVSNTITQINGTGNIPHGNYLFGIADELTVPTTMGVIGSGNYVRGKSNTVTMTEYTGGVLFGNLVNGQAINPNVQNGTGIVKYGIFINGNADSFTQLDSTGTVLFGNLITGVSNVSNAQNGTGVVDFGNFVQGISDPTYLKEFKGTIAYGNILFGQADSVTAQDGGGSVNYGNLLNGNSDSFAVTSGSGTLAFGNLIIGVPHVVSMHNGMGTVAFGNLVKGSSDTVTLTEYSGGVLFGNAVFGNSDPISIQSGTGDFPAGNAFLGHGSQTIINTGSGLISFGNRLFGRSDSLNITGSVGIIPEHITPNTGGGIPKLVSLRNHILSIPNEIKIEPDDIAIFTDAGSIKSQAEGTNQHFTMTYKAIIILTDFSADPIKLFYWILQWMRVNQPDHPADAIQFESDQLDENKTDIQITINISEDIKVESSTGGVRIYSANEVDINPTLFPAENWTLTANDEELTNWINGG